MTDVVTLTGFLLARVTEDERRIRKFGVVSGSRQMPTVFMRLTAECETKRRIIALHQPDWQLKSGGRLGRKCRECHRPWHQWRPDCAVPGMGPEQGCPTLRLYAELYSDHPDYREEWRP